MQVGTKIDTDGTVVMRFSAGQASSHHLALRSPLLARHALDVSRGSPGCRRCTARGDLHSSLKGTPLSRHNCPCLGSRV